MAHSFLKLNLHFISALPGKGLKRCFLISNVSAGNITLCCKQHIACELWVEQAWPRIWKVMGGHLNCGSFAEHTEQLNAKFNLKFKYGMLLKCFFGITVKPESQIK